jgi:serine/threonine-protein kinase
MSIVAANQSALDESVRMQLQPDLDVMRRLGTGSTANVYLAREPALQRLVAVKVLKPDISTDAILRRRFEREAQSAARIRHPHVTAIHRVGRLADDTPYLVMEYIDGRSLRDALASTGPFRVPDATRILAEVASALSAAHANGIVHRDVRPENVFLEKQSNRAVLADFGLAALLDTGAEPNARLTAPGFRVGDVRYMSPEQIAGDALTEQSDIYAFGVLACEMLTGRSAYGSSADSYAAPGSRTLRVLRDVQELDAALASLIERCLAANPLHRPLAREIADTLQARGAAGAQADTLFDQFFHELRQRRVFKVLLAYTAFAVGVIGLGASLSGPFEVSDEAFRRFVFFTAAGLPLVLGLSWLFDFRRGRIERTRRPHGTERTGTMMWVVIIILTAAVAVTGWLLLQ